MNFGPSVSRSAASVAGSLRIFFVLSLVNLVLGAMVTVATLEDVVFHVAAVLPALALLALAFRAAEAFQRVPDGDGSVDVALRAGLGTLRVYFLVSVLFALVAGVAAVVRGM